jgi:DNA/RNA endonuclease YhcR with UshA esterase domain
MKAAYASLIAADVLLAPAAAVAHHSFAAEYDVKKPVTLKGTVTSLEWTNPHARIYIDVKDEKGTVSNWNLELASPNVLVRQGWSRHTLKVGDQITVEGSQAKDGSQMANARTVTLADGKKVFAFSPSDAPAQ